MSEQAVERKLVAILAALRGENRPGPHYARMVALYARHETARQQMLAIARGYDHLAEIAEQRLARAQPPLKDHRTP